MNDIKHPALLGLAVTVALGFSGVASAVPQWCLELGGPPCTGGPGGGEEPPEAATNRLSYPVILAENVGPAPAEVDWVFYDLTGLDPTDPTVCAQETGNAVPIPATLNCYYGRQRDSEGAFIDGTEGVWWLSQRIPNNWKVLSIAPADTSGTTPVPVTAVDVGDLLESSISIKAKQIRTEFTLLQDVPLTDPLFGDHVTTGSFPLDLSSGDPDGAGPCAVPSATQSIDCFAAVEMSRAVPGTDQSINEIQGTNFGLNVGTLTTSDPTATSELIDPGMVKFNKLDPTEGYEATVYSNCARLIIQKITDFDTVVWSSTADDGNERGGFWVNGANPPAVNVAAWDGSYSGEINAGGSLIMGYNFNAKELPQEEKSGDYRLTFVLEGGSASGGKCSTPLNAVFDNNTKVVNLGEQHPGQVLTATELGATHGEGGAVYVDVVLGASGGGGGGNSNRP